MLKVIDKIRQSAYDQAIKNVAEEVHFSVTNSEQFGKLILKIGFGNCRETIIHKIYLDANEPDVDELSWHRIRH